MAERRRQAPAGPHLVYGRHVVLELLTRQASQVRELWYADDGRPGASGKGAEGTAPRELQPVLAAARAAQVPVRPRPRRELDEAAEDGVHQGLVALVVPFAYAPFAALLAGPTPPLVLVLDQIQDPRNLGALVRSAAAFGASGVLVPQDRSAPLSAVAIKASAGAAYLLPIVQAKNLRRGLELLGAAGVWRCGLAGDAERRVQAVDFRLPSAIVIGAEGTGLRRLTREHCDLLASVPAPGMESLNAAVAGSIALYEAARQRGRDARA